MGTVLEEKLYPDAFNVLEFRKSFMYNGENN